MLRSFERPWAPQRKPETILLTNASLVDVQRSTIIAKASILISAGEIKEIRTAGQSNDQEYDKTIDLEGKYVSPGLIDCHAHVTATPGDLHIGALYAKSPSTIALRTSYVLRKMLLRGFTTVRDTGGCDAGIRSAVEEGLIAGPRLVIAGQALSQTGGHADFRRPHQGTAHKCCGDLPAMGRICDGVPQCLEATRDELRKGANFIKIMCGGGVATPTDPLDMIQFTAEEIQAITTTAKMFGTYVTAHAYTSASIRHAVDNGVEAIEHANLIDVETAKYCAEKGVIFTPTLITLKSWKISPFDTALPQSGHEKLDGVLSHGRTSLKILQDANALVCYGSDLLAGAHDLQSEGFALVAEVFSAAEVLRCATVNASKLLRMEGRIGVIAEGASADLLILESNPLHKVEALKGIECIIKEGRVVSSKIENLVVDEMYGTIQEC